MLEMMCFLLCHTDSSLPLKRLLFLPPSSSTVFQSILPGKWASGHAAAAAEAVVAGHYVFLLPQSTKPRLRISYSEPALLSPWIHIAPTERNKHTKTFEKTYDNRQLLAIEVNQWAGMQVKHSQHSYVTAQYFPTEHTRENKMQFLNPGASL